MANASKKQDYELLSGCLLFGDKQKFQHFLKNFGNEFLININLDDETLLNHEDKNPIDWTIQLNKKQTNNNPKYKQKHHKHHLFTRSKCSRKVLT